MPDLSRWHTEEWGWGSEAAVYAPLPQGGKTLSALISWSFHWKGISTILEHVRVMVYEDPFLKYANLENQVSMNSDSCKPLLKGSAGLRTSLNDSDVSVLWVPKVVRRLERSRTRSGSEAAVFRAGRLSDERRRSADGKISVEKELHTPQSQNSLRRHRWYQSMIKLPQ